MERVPRWRELHDRTVEALRAARVDSPEAEARWLLEHVSGEPGEAIVADAGPATRRGTNQLEVLLERRLGGEPLQYVLGEWSFRDLDLLVDRRVLIPRPETEIVVEVALREAERLGARTGDPDRWAGAADRFAVADLGTGSGAIAIALERGLPDAEVWATDASADALAVARANVAGCGATRVRVVEGTWFDALPAEARGALRLIVSNPPYIAAHEVGDLPAEVVDWEPHGALVSGETGFECLEEILQDAPGWLATDGVLVLEHAPQQAEPLRAAARRAGFAEAETVVDLSGRDRVLVARRLR
ncbi:MAG: peptide chain release factor N(5)-glutamine methyltransferase [Actinomycetes bacterium]